MGSFKRHYLGNEVLDVTDADTIKLRIDLGFNLDGLKIKCRLYGIACLERNDPGGLESKLHVAELVPVGSEVDVRSIEWDKYSQRFDGIVYMPGNEESLNHRLIREGYAVPWNGRGTQPKPSWPPVPIEY